MSKTKSTSPLSWLLPILPGADSGAGAVVAVVVVVVVVVVVGVVVVSFLVPL